MSLLIFVVIVIVVLALGLYLIDLIPNLDGNLKNILKVVAVAVGIIVILTRAGLTR